ncbi:hypothetical protein AB0A77_31140 [Streptomyces varsoviensis]|uniref:hypothetical protein n=1 Tax=Streptomyces varsoviensis TaxID=67373 RepID=UPI0033F1FFD6
MGRRRGLGSTRQRHQHRHQYRHQRQRQHQHRRRPDGSRPLVTDRNWAGDLRAAVSCSVALGALLLLIDLARHALDAPRAGCWAGIALLLFVVLFPPRVRAGDGWLAVRGLLRERRVRTDVLTLVRSADGMAPRLILRDAGGRRVELDPKVLAANPLLWHLLDTGARRSMAHGFLRDGAAELRALADRIDGEAAERLLREAGLD